MPIDPTSAVAAAVMKYLVEHPSASDSLEGVHRWWVPQTVTAASIETVGRALELLVNQGLVEEHTLLDGRIVYARVPREASSQ